MNYISFSAAPVCAVSMFVAVLVLLLLVLLLHNVLGLDGINTNGQHISSIRSCVPVWCFYFSFLRSHHRDQQPCSSGLHLHCQLELRSLELFSDRSSSFRRLRSAISDLRDLGDRCAVCLGWRANFHVRPHKSLWMIARKWQTGIQIVFILLFTDAIA